MPDRIRSPRLAALLSLALALLAAPASADEAKAYYFPSGDNCTVMVDFQLDRVRLDALPPGERDPELARAMLEEFAASGTAECPAAKVVRLLAVYVPGTDNYGRPDFGRRVNLLRVEGKVAEVREAAEGNLDWEQIQAKLSVETY